MPLTTRAFLILQLAAATAFASALIAQDVADAAPEWNDRRSLEIVDAAIRTRQEAFSDSSLRSFEADAEGFVYLLAEIEGEERLVRADQVALHILWQAPDRVVQTIVGRRFDQRLPSSVRYHLDHLGITVDNFGSSIRIGEGDEVAGVRHPVWRGANRHYEYRLSDSTEIRFGRGRARVYEIEVRPLRFERPGVIGRLWIDRDTWAIARMSFTFTPVSYRDPRLAGLDVDVENALWDGRYWLPIRQVVEVRRSSTWLSFPISATIRTDHRIGAYRINQELAAPVSPGQTITAVGPELLARYENWEAELLDGPIDPGDTAAIDMEEVRAKAREIAGRRVVPTGRFKLWLQGVSSLLRGRRAEGVLVGAGGESILPFGAARAWVGYPFGRQEVELLAEIDVDVGSDRLRIEGYRHRLSDVGPVQAASGVVSSLSLAVDGEDFVDSFFRDGVRASLLFPLLQGTGSISAAWESQTSATLSIGAEDARPVRPIRDGDLWSLTASLRPRLPDLLGARSTGILDAEAGILDPEDEGEFQGYVRWMFGVELNRRRPDSPWAWEAEIALALAAGTLPPQRLVLLGGRQTVPGYEFRRWGGDQAWLAEILGSRQLLGRWLNLRAFASVGWVGVTTVSEEAANAFSALPSDGLRPSLGAGVGLLNDVLRVDVARGLDRGRWEWMISFNRSLWPIL
ncbi:MAG: hypothetical protein JSV95_06830 [Gemmatimonadota bacterium]|nr:MAG: hypothetical protein JSV95_06830 [Gemmatimonadota bacterium]